MFCIACIKAYLKLTGLKHGQVAFGKESGCGAPALWPCDSYWTVPQPRKSRREHANDQERWWCPNKTIIQTQAGRARPVDSWLKTPHYFFLWLFELTERFRQSLWTHCCSICHCHWLLWDWYVSCDLTHMSEALVLTVDFVFPSVWFLIICWSRCGCLLHSGYNPPILQSSGWEALWGLGFRTCTHLSHSTGKATSKAMPGLKVI